jgi:hypothetical protein
LNIEVLTPAQLDSLLEIDRTIFPWDCIGKIIKTPIGTCRYKIIGIMVKNREQYFKLEDIRDKTTTQVSVDSLKRKYVVFANDKKDLTI